MRKAQVEKAKHPKIDKVVVFKQLTNGALLLDETGRILYIKAKKIDMGDAEANRKTVAKLVDDGYTEQFEVLQIQEPRMKTKVKAFFSKLKLGKNE